MLRALSPPPHTEVTLLPAVFECALHEGFLTDSGVLEALHAARPPPPPPWSSFTKLGSPS